jgi:hypothetical protein
LLYLVIEKIVDVFIRKDTIDLPPRADAIYCCRSKRADRRDDWAVFFFITLGLLPTVATQTPKSLRQYLLSETITILLTPFYLPHPTLPFFHDLAIVAISLSIMGRE